MEKISGILPSSTRITSVDLKSSGSVRAGTPNYGRPVGVTAAAKREMAAADARAQVLHEKQMAKRSGDEKADMVQRMADNFFNTRNKATDTISASEFMDMDPDADLNPLTESVSLTASSEAEVDALDLPEVGAYLDVEA